MLIFLMSYKQTYQIMVISVKTFKYDAWNKVNKIITNLHNFSCRHYYDSQLSFNHTSSKMHINHFQFCLYYFALQNVLYIIFPETCWHRLDFSICLCVGVWEAGCVFVCGGVWGCVGVCKYTVPPNKDLDVDTQYKRGCTSDQGCPQFPVMPGPGAWVIANSIKMFKTGPQMDNNNDFFFNCQKVQTCKTK